MLSYFAICSLNVLSILTKIQILDFWMARLLDVPKRSVHLAWKFEFLSFKTLPEWQISDN